MVKARVLKIDTDVSRDDRKKAVNYFLEKYGSKYVAQIMTVSKFSIKTIVKSILSVRKRNKLFRQFIIFQRKNLYNWPIQLLKQ